MTTIEIVVPEDLPVQQDGETYATRGLLPDAATLTIVDNGKPRARELLQYIATEVGTRLPIVKVEVVSKPSSAIPLDADTVRMMAARSHLVISGLGD